MRVSPISGRRSDSGKLRVERADRLNLAVFRRRALVTYRHFRHVTLHIRPSFGAIRELATPRPGDPIATMIVQQLAPAGSKTDWTGFYGFGGGVDLAVSKHVWLRIQGDFVYDHLFNDILRDGRFTTRFSVGPVFTMGRNIAKE